ncbi:MAG: hypothetical protein CME70_16305 [Halobacteriovorax sp.]|nr:hypothetical protein [Halobacteriovorax sp.]|tara:strand:- start:127678 stop:129225 length:1548 start_codon:yes stop_codon:yes gene_type:complete
MAKRIQLTLDFEVDLEQEVTKRFPEYNDFRILSQSLDARGANRGKRPRYQYSLELIKSGEKFSIIKEEFKNLGALSKKPIIIGAGPGGLFCALRLADYGVPSIIVERGERAHKRMKDIAKAWRYGEFNPESNVCYGEGGAGLFSDGKLITRIKSPYVNYVMNRLVDFGAPEDTAYLSNPHLGSNKIRVLIGKVSEYLQEKGCEIHYNTKVEGLDFVDKKIVGVSLNNGQKLVSDNVVLATGHSASDMYEHLEELNVAMKPKSFAVGVRIEHPRSHMDYIQYGEYIKYDLGAARYRLSWENPETKKGTYSFCMCPGGYVLSSGTENNGLVVNGMSNYARNSPWSNSALVVSVEAGKDFDGELLAGMKFQRNIEKAAYNLSKIKANKKEVPFIELDRFLEGKIGTGDNPKTSCPSGIFREDLQNILPSFITDHLKNAFSKFEKSLKGFSEKAILIAPETRTSAPVTIERDRDTLESLSHSGLYPCGEGAGHAGGITSAAVDGVKIAMSILRKEKNLD